jgi:hypothetical protein
MSYSEQDWERLGRLLMQRRGQLGSQFLNRQEFVRTTGLNERLVYDLENARRTSYRPATVAAVESAYRLPPGFIDKALADASIQTAEPGDAPSRLGQMLIHRRIALSPDYAARRAFAASVGLAEEFVADLEHGRIVALTGEQQAQVERAYCWTPGSVAAALDGREPGAIDIRNVTGSAFMSASTGATVAAEASDVVMMDLRDAPDDVSDDVKALWNNYPIERRIIWHLPIPLYERELVQEYMHGMRAAVRKAQQEQRDRNGGSQAS